MRHGVWFALLVTVAAAGVAAAGDVQVFCEPGLRVYVDGELAAISSRLDDGAFLADLAPGRHTLRVERDGFVPQSFEVVVGPVPVEVTVGELVPAPAEARPAAPLSVQPTAAVGSLVVTSAPQVCVVEVDGVRHTKSAPQLTIGGLAAGEHTVVFSKPGYEPVSEAVTVHPGSVVSVHGNLKAARVETARQGRGALRLLSEPNRCTVRFAGRLMDKTSLNLNLSRVPAGEHPLVVSIAGRELRTTVLILDGQRAIVRVSFLPGDEPFVVSYIPM